MFNINKYEFNLVVMKNILLCYVTYVKLYIYYKDGNDELLESSKLYKFYKHFDDFIKKLHINDEKCNVINSYNNSNVHSTIKRIKSCWDEIWKEFKKYNLNGTLCNNFLLYWFYSKMIESKLDVFSIHWIYRKLQLSFPGNNYILDYQKLDNKKAFHINVLRNKKYLYDFVEYSENIKKVFVDRTSENNLKYCNYIKEIFKLYKQLKEDNRLKSSTTYAHELQYFENKINEEFLKSLETTCPDNCLKYVFDTNYITLCPPKNYDPNHGVVHTPSLFTNINFLNVSGINNKIQKINILSFLLISFIYYIVDNLHSKIIHISFLFKYECNICIMFYFQDSKIKDLPSFKIYNELDENTDNTSNTDIKCDEIKEFKNGYPLFIDLCKKVAKNLKKLNETKLAADENISCSYFTYWIYDKLWDTIKNKPEYISGIPAITKLLHLGYKLNNKNSKVGCYYEINLNLDLWKEKKYLHGYFMNFDNINNITNPDNENYKSYCDYLNYIGQLYEKHIGACCTYFHKDDTVKEGTDDDPPIKDDYCPDFFKCNKKYNPYDLLSKFHCDVKSSSKDKEKVFELATFDRYSKLLTKISEKSSKISTAHNVHQSRQLSPVRNVDKTNELKNLFDIVKGDFFYSATVPLFMLMGAFYLFFILYKVKINDVLKRIKM
ncbi:variable surface protein Vir24 [Plasmodium vivax Mauritania I]|uniref:Variable surface protein Vir24 n=1 Tax=Plasmodium vivax Mauritania I TaxID=1035515 RepID=A0A0J9VYX7_PLAVI|nr:variable surface protein Vir24 [Plasmodium vivax Mauritania I]